MTQLIRYEAARTALAECQRVDEVKDIRDKAEAMAAYARQAKDTELIQYATEIKVRAERKAGELLRDAKARGDRDPGGRTKAIESQRATQQVKTLADIGVTNTQSSRWQSLAAMSEEHFETAVATAKDTAGQVTTAFMLREATKAKPGKPKAGPKADALREELKAAKQRGVSMISTYARLTITALRSVDSVTEEENAILDELADLIQNVTVY